MESSSNPDRTTELPEAQPEPTGVESSTDELSPVAPAPQLFVEEAEPSGQTAPDLDAVEQPSPWASAPATPSLDLPSLELPHPAYSQPQQPQAPAYQTPGQAYAQPQYGQPPYAQPAYGQAPSGQPQYGQQLAYPAGGHLSAADEATWSSAAHWSAILASFAGLGFLGPLLVLLIQGPKSARVRANAVESLNFEITFIISMLASVLLMLVVVGFVTIILLPLVWLILRIVAAVQTSGGQDYRYPLNIRLVK